MRSTRRALCMIWLCAVLAVLTLAYLVVAMLRPDWFSN
ncbi:MAG: potassium-transporting ATPase subunit F [Phycisphaerales bacterium]